LNNACSFFKANVVRMYFRHPGTFRGFDPRQAGKTMGLERIDREVKKFFEPVPSPAKSLSATPKVRELIGIALPALSRCPHCAFYHTQLARANGATESEIEEAFREPERYLEGKKLLSLPD
jgi:AhpD family alkylhydroperoxidase